MRIPSIVAATAVGVAAGYVALIWGEYGSHLRTLGDVVVFALMATAPLLILAAASTAQAVANRQRAEDWRFALVGALGLCIGVCWGMALMTAMG